MAIAKQAQTRLFPQYKPLIRRLVYAGICIPFGRFVAVAVDGKHNHAQLGDTLSKPNSFAYDPQIEYVLSGL